MIYFDGMNNPWDYQHNYEAEWLFIKGMDLLGEIRMPFASIVNFGDGKAVGFMIFEPEEYHNDN